MARRHPIAVAIKQQAGEEARLTMSCACVPLGGVAGKLCLNRIPQRLIDDRPVLTRMGLLLMDDLASIDPRANGLPPRRRPDALVRNLLWMPRASSSSFTNRTKPSSA